MRSFRLLLILLVNWKLSVCGTWGSCHWVKTENIKNTKVFSCPLPTPGEMSDEPLKYKLNFYVESLREFFKDRFRFKIVGGDGIESFDIPQEWITKPPFVFEYLYCRRTKIKVDDSRNNSAEIESAYCPVTIVIENRNIFTSASMGMMCHFDDDGSVYEIPPSEFSEYKEKVKKKKEEDVKNHKFSPSTDVFRLTVVFAGIVTIVFVFVVIVIIVTYRVYNHFFPGKYERKKTIGKKTKEKHPEDFDEDEENLRMHVGEKNEEDDEEENLQIDVQKGKKRKIEERKGRMSGARVINRHSEPVQFHSQRHSALQYKRLQFANRDTLQPLSYRDAERQFEERMQQMEEERRTHAKVLWSVRASSFGVAASSPSLTTASFSTSVSASTIASATPSASTSPSTSALRPSSSLSSLSSASLLLPPSSTVISCSSSSSSSLLSSPSSSSSSSSSPSLLSSASTPSSSSSSTLRKDDEEKEDQSRMVDLDVLDLLTPAGWGKGREGWG